MKCACGRPLHYTDPIAKAAMDRLVADMGEHVVVHCEGRKYSVSRHFIALHGLKAWELEELADKGIVERLEGADV